MLNDPVGQIFEFKNFIPVIALDPGSKTLSFDKGKNYFIVWKEKFYSFLFLKFWQKR